MPLPHNWVKFVLLVSACLAGTAAAQASDELWYAPSYTTSAITGVYRGTVNGTSALGSPTSVNVTPTDYFAWLDGIAVDPSLGKYFVVDEEGEAGMEIIEGNLNGSGSPQVIYTAGNGGFDYINGITVCPSLGRVYFSVTDASFPVANTDTGIYYLSEAGSGTRTATRLVNLSSAANSPTSIAIDAANNLLFFTMGYQQTAAANGVAVADLVSGGLLNSPAVSYSASGTQTAWGLVIDPTNHKLYWSTVDSDTAGNNVVYSGTYATEGGYAITDVASVMSTGSTALEPAALAVDPAAGTLYVAETPVPILEPPAASNAKIVEVSTSGGTGAPIASLSGGSGEVLDALTLEVTPAVSVSGTATAVASGSAVILDSSATVSGTPQFDLASAQIVLSGRQPGDVLEFNGGSSTDFGITASYNSATGTLTLSGTDTLAHYQSALQTVAFHTTSASGTSRTVEWTVNDGNLASSTVATAITVEVPPVVTAGATATFDGGGSAATLDSGLQVTMANSGNPSSATVTISSGYVAGDTLNFSNNPATMGNIAALTNSNGVLTLVSAGDSATVAQWSAALESVTYSFSPVNGDPSAGGSDNQRTISWAVTDAYLSSTAAQSTLDVVHEPPTIAAAGTQTYYIGGSPLALNGLTALADPDSGGLLSGATVAIGSGFQAGDVLSFSGLAGLASSYDPVNGVLTLSGTASVAEYEAALESIVFSSTAGAGARTIDWSVTDGVDSSGVVSSAVDAETLPVVNAGGTATFLGGGSPQTLDPGVTVSDANSATLVGATVAFETWVPGDTLNFTDQNGITGAYSPVLGALVLAGTASLADYQEALASITYSFSPANGDPTDLGTQTTRTVQWTINDGTVSSAAATSQLDLVHEAPILSAGGTVTLNAGGAPVALDPTLTVADVDSGNDLDGATVDIASGFAGSDELLFTNQNGITGNYDSAVGVLNLQGTATLAQYQTALDSVAFSAAVAGAQTIAWTVTDGVAASNQATSTADVQSVPVVTAGASAMFQGGGSPAVLDGGLTVTDSSSPTLVGATVMVSSGLAAGDTLNFTPQGGITGSYSSGLLTLSGTASVATYQAALQSITFSYAPADGDPTLGGADTSRTITWTVNDGANASAPVTSQLDVTHVAPSVTAGGTVSLILGGSPVDLDGAITLADADSAGALAGATVQIGAGFAPGDELLYANQNGIAGSYNAATGTLTLSGGATIADYQAALDSVTFASTSQTSGTRTIDWTVTDGVDASAAAVSDVNAESMPVVAAGGTVSFQGGGLPVLLDPGLVVSDAGSPALASATIALTGFVPGDTLSFQAQGGITGAYNAANGTLNLSGTASVAAYQAALQSVAYSFSPLNGDPTAGGGATFRIITWTVNDGANASAPVTSQLDVTHVAPTVAAGGTASFVGGGTAVTLDGSLTVGDPDSGGTLAGATVSIGGLVAGDTLNFTNGSGIVGSYDAASGTLTLTGTAPLAAYQAALASITYRFSPADGDPTAGGAATSRTISWTINDGVASSAAGSHLDVSHAAPAVTAGGSVTLLAGGSPIALDGSIALADADSGGELAGATVQIGSGFSTGDVLQFANQNGITGSYNGATGRLTLSGTATVAQYQAALDSILFGSTAATGGPRTIDWTVTDGVDVSAQATSDVIVDEPSPPVVTAGATAAFQGGGSAAVLDPALMVSDAESPTLLGATVSLSGEVSGDTLNFAAQNGITGSYDAATGILTLSGAASVAAYQSALESITYSFSPSDGDPSAGGSATARTLAWVVNDGISSSAAATSALNVVHINPALTAGAAAIFTLGDSSVVLDPVLTAVDPDSSGQLIGATVSLSGGFLAGDLLVFTNQNGISGSYDASTGVLSLSGAASLADYQAALQSVAYATTASDPTDGGADTGRTIRWLASDGAGSSSPATSTLSLMAATPTITWQDPASIVYGTALSSTQLDATATFGAQTVSGTFVYDPASGTVLGGGDQTLSATFTPANLAEYTAVNDQVTLDVTQAPQTIDFTAVTGAEVGVPVVLTATASSGLTPVTFALTSGNASLSGSTLTINDENPVVVTASQAGSADYQAVSTTQTITAQSQVSPPPPAQAQTITFPAISSQHTYDPPFALTATASSGLPVSYSIVTGPATVSGSTLTLSGAAGVVTVEATQSGDSSYLAATPVALSFTVLPPPFAAFFGSVSGSGGLSAREAASGDNIAATLSADGTQGTLVGYLPSISQAFVAALAPNSQGQFTVTTTTFGVSGSPEALTISGSATASGISGTIEPLGMSFSASADALSGSTASIAGLYQGSSGGSAAASTYAIVGSQGDVFVLAVTPSGVGAGTGSINANTGSFSVAVSSSIAVSGTVDSATDTVSGSITTGPNGSASFSGSGAAEPSNSVLGNMSGLGVVNPAAPLIVGFVVDGPAEKSVVLRGVGPGLLPFGLSSPLAHPLLTLYDAAGGVLASNDGWGGGAALATAFAQVGAFALAPTSADAALTATLAPGAYTIIISDADNDAGGAALAEIYDASIDPSGITQRLINVSTLGRVSSNASLSGGFVVAGNAPKTVLIRGIGPGLGAFGVSDALPSPLLTVYTASGTTEGENQAWGTPESIGQGGATPSAIAAADAATGAFALVSGSRDSALILTLPPGRYSAVVTSADGSAGAAMVEVYEISAP